MGSRSVASAEEGWRPRRLFPAATVVVLATALGCAGGDGQTHAQGADGGVSPRAAFDTNDSGVVSRGCVSSPKNFEIPGNDCDDDGDGLVDVVPRCDADLPENGTADHFAKAIGLCNRATTESWGLVSARYSGSYGTEYVPNPSQTGILPRFGSAIRPRHGSSLGVLSSGVAREWNGNAGASFKQGLAMTGPGQLPPGYPQPAEGCVIDSSVFDVATVKLNIAVPANAKGVAFDFNYYSGEWPEWVCTRYNDGFLAMLTSRATGGVPTNISFDGLRNPVSVNNVYFDRCTAGALTGCRGQPAVPKTSLCAGGETELAGTGFSARDFFCGEQASSAGGATGWLTSQAAVVPGEVITLEFLIWDTGDSNFDSSVLLDNLRWQVADTETRTERPK
ncbi:MAG: choice-of-anchor L domain-containing protein [Myxococcales bacterium]|nr:choice-of-anchor L domain-containing protein [Myxococcales bacterium]